VTSLWYVWANFETVQRANVDYRLRTRRWLLFVSPYMSIWYVVCSKDSYRFSERRPGGSHSAFQHDRSRVCEPESVRRRSRDAIGQEPSQPAPRDLRDSSRRLVLSTRTVPYRRVDRRIGLVTESSLRWGLWATKYYLQLVITMEVMGMCLHTVGVCVDRDRDRNQRVRSLRLNGHQLRIGLGKLYNNWDISVLYGHLLTMWWYKWRVVTRCVWRSIRRSRRTDLQRLRNETGVDRCRSRSSRNVWVFGSLQPNGSVCDDRYRCRRQEKTKQSPLWIPSLQVGIVSRLQ